MPDDVQISYSFSLGESPSAPEPAVHAFADCDTLPVPGGVVLVNRRTGRRLPLMAEMAGALQHCAEFRSLAEHTETLLARFPELAGSREDVRRTLEAVRDGGLMISADALCERINRVSQESDPPPARVFVITCDRPAALERLLDSVAEASALAGQQAFYVVDDSREPGNRALNRRRLEQFAAASPCPVHYVGPEEQARLVADIAARAPDAGAGLRFAADAGQWAGYRRYGLARNLCLLLSAGCRAVVLDDDVLCTALKSPRSGPGVSLGSAARGADFYRDREQWRAAAEPAGFSPVHGHLRCLGLSLPLALHALGQPALGPRSLAGAVGRHFDALGADTRVLVTLCGSYGDSGAGDNAWLINLDSASRDRLLASSQGLEGALRQRECWLGQSSPRFAPRPVMSQVTGLDNRALLPPYFPVFRGEDQLFGTVLGLLHPSSLALEYDWAVPHLPLESRSGNPAGDSAVPLGSLGLVGRHLEQGPPPDPGLPVEHRLQALVGCLERLAGGSDTALRAAFARALTAAQAATLQALSDQQAEAGGAPASWTDYLRRQTDAMSRALQGDTDCTAVPGLPAGIAESEVLDRARRFAAGYAAAMRHWPAIRRAASQVSVEPIPC